MPVLPKDRHVRTFIGGPKEGAGLNRIFVTLTNLLLFKKRVGIVVAEGWKSKNPLPQKLLGQW